MSSKANRLGYFVGSCLGILALVILGIAGIAIVGLIILMFLG